LIRLLKNQKHLKTVGLVLGTLLKIAQRMLKKVQEQKSNGLFLSTDIDLNKQKYHKTIDSVLGKSNTTKKMSVSPRNVT
jgi:hypothetical protein